MSQICDVTGKKPLSGNHVSHAHNKTKRRFKPNLHKHCYAIPNTTRSVTLKLSSAAMRMIDKYGILAVLKRINHPSIKSISEDK